jgi:hypothetical protein
MLNNFVWSIFQGYKEAKESSRDPFKELEKSWYLYEIDDLEELRKQATNKEQHNLILDHMYKYDATQVDYFRQIEKKIINYYWEE